MGLADKTKQVLSSESSADTAKIAPKPTLKQHVGDAANNWLARNRSLVLRQTPVWAQSLAVLLVGLGGTALLVGFFFRIDEVVTVQGQLKSIGGTVEVKTPAAGKVAEVFFEDGQFVEKGDKLIKFDTRQALERKALLEKLIRIQKIESDNQVRTVLSQLEILEKRKDVLERRYTTKSKIIDEMTVLVEQGGFQRLQYLEQKDELFQLDQSMAELSEQENQLNLQIEQIRLQSSKSIGQFSLNLKEAELQLQYQNVEAPISGIIFDPQADPDGVLIAGERIVSIVSQQGLYAEVYVPNKDIGFIKLGQDAKVRVDAFPFTRYGDLPGKVSQISADVLKPDVNQEFYRFPVKLSLSKFFLDSNSKKVPLKPGMSVTTNLKLRDKRVISLLSDILVDQTDSVRSIRQQ